MKAYVTHDEEGNIVSVNMPSPDDDANISIVPEPGRQLCEINLSGKAKDFADEGRAVEKLMEIAHGFRVDMPTRKGKLVSLERQTNEKRGKRSGNRPTKRSG